MRPRPSRLGGAGGFGLHGADLGRDLGRGLDRALGELSDLVGHYREAAALVAGARGLDRGVKREQVRLVRDVLDHGDDLADLLRALALLLDHLGERYGRGVDLLDRLGRDVRDVLAALGDLHGLGRGLGATRRRFWRCR